MAKLKSEQARSVWMRTVIGFIASLALFTIAYLAFGIFFGERLSADIGDWLADSTSTWTYVNAEDFNKMWESGLISVGNLQVLENSDIGTVAFRDLSFYNALKGMKPLVVVVVYVACAAAITVYFLRKPIRMIDEVSEAISDPGLPEGKPVTLPEDLRPTQLELGLLQARIAKSEQAAKDAEERKNELVTYLAHDIRTPLTSVLGYLDLMCDTERIAPDKQRSFASAALAKARRLEVLAEELFEITRYNTQNIPIEREQLDLELLCQQVAEEFYPQTSAKDIEIRIDAESGLSAFMDSSRMGRALENIVKNAITHANEKSVIDIKTYEENDETVISIKNEGKEISPEHLQHIFERFYRGDSARNQDAGGTGLGLAIAKEIVEAHGGTINATSELGTTVFEIRVPPYQLYKSLQSERICQV